MLARKLERAIAGIISGADLSTMDAKSRNLALKMKRQATDVRLDIRDYEYSETRREQITHADASRKRLQNIRSDILAASEYEIFSAVEVVQLSTWIDQMMDKLE